MIFDVVNAYKAQKLTMVLPSKDGSMKRQIYVFLEKTSILVKERLIFFPQKQFEFVCFPLKNLTSPQICEKCL
jgi:hypothetical protein